MSERLNAGATKLDGPVEQVGQAGVEYGRRLEELERRQVAANRVDTLLGRLKLASGATIALLAFACVGRPGFLYPLGGVVVAFVALLVAHERVLRGTTVRERLLRFYRRGLARLDGSWAHFGFETKGKKRKGVEIETGERFLTPEHPYARDLDLFGRGSVFHLLSTARTAEGEATLAEWLLSPAAQDEARARQEAVRELAPGLTLREALATVGEDVRETVHGRALAAWGERADVWRGNGVRVGTAVLAALWVASLVGWAKWEAGWAVLLVSLVNYGVRYRLNGRVEASLEGLDRAAKELGVLAGLLRLVEAEQFESAKLRELRAALERDGVAPSEAIGRLGRLMELLDSRHNMMFKAADLFLFWSVQLAVVADGWKREFGPAVRGWLAVAGEFEALESLGGYAFEHPEDAWPEFVEGPAYVRMDGFAHPLLPEARAVRNDLELGGALQLVVISGPNMAGKSTLLRGLGVNVVLAQAGAPVRAKGMRLSRLAVAASIAVMDSLESGISRFYAEIRRVKVVSDLADGPVPVLFLLDELLSGTNSHDRFTGTEWIVRSLLGRGAVGIVTTHDLALTVIPETLVERTGARGINCHFEDTIVDGKLVFDYRLSPGVVQTSNALELMRSIGLDVDS